MKGVVICGALVLSVLLVSSSSTAYLGLTLPDMKKQFGEPVKEVRPGTYLFQMTAKTENKLLKISSGDVIQVEAVVEGGRVVKETVRLPRKLDSQKDFLNWVWTYARGGIADINSPKLKEVAGGGGEKAYYFKGGVWALALIDPEDGMTTGIVVGKE